jgi:PKD repeat protein
MTIPTSSLYPDQFDTDDNLFLVHDALRLRLAEDYNPGDTKIKVEGHFETVARWPATGIITLTEQCNELPERAVSFYYSEFDSEAMEIRGLEIIPGFPDVKKPKKITNVTINVIDKHHNHLKNALIAIQKFCGVKGTEDKEPFGPTLEGRTNFLRRLVLQPKAWFSSDKRTGNVPLEIEFIDQSFRLGTDGTAGPVKITWDFGDHTSSTISLISVISADSYVGDSPLDMLVRDTDGGKIKKVYHKPGIYDVKLTVENDFGKDVCILPNFINARVKAPNTAIVKFIENTSNQEATPGIPPNGPFQVTPKIRSPINTLIEIEVPEGENPATPGYSFAGELLVPLDPNNPDGAKIPLDPVTDWTWALGDDLLHPNIRSTKASYSVGGIYDMKLRVDTQFGAYRITTYEDAIDIVENRNLWLWLYTDATTVRSYEYGLISETFKLTTAPTLTINKNDSFLNGLPSESQQKTEFNRNNGFAPRSNIGSGLGGTALLYYATGRNKLDPVTSEKINVIEYDGFSGSYVTKTPITRQWNWAHLNSNSASYFIFGTVDEYLPNQSPTNQTNQVLSFNDLVVSEKNLTSATYLNGAQELMENVAIYDNSGNSVYGNFSVYRTAWKDNTGYIMRNDGVGPFFRLKSFYRTEGTVGNPFTFIRKMQDVQGPTKLEGQLLAMSTGIYFLNNSGSVSKFYPQESIWRSGGPGVNSLLYRGLQDTTVQGFDNAKNTLLAVSDGDKRAYLSFDYSPNAFLRFNEIDLTFVSLGNRPQGQQWIMGVY